MTRPDGSLWELGRGAMGVSYLAKDPLLDREVALKVVNAQFLQNETARKRFQREAKAAASITHENVAMVYQFGQEGDSFFYAMEFIRGETVEQLLLREGPVAPKKAADIAAQVCKALSAAETKGLIHRDIKPANLMLTEHDGALRVKVIDFGLAKPANGFSDGEATVTVAGFVGTPYFASPEQLQETDLDIRSDIYSLGVTLWYMLAGNPPFSGTFANLIVQHIHSALPMEKLAAVPPCLRSALEKSLEKKPENRFQKPSDFRAALDACMAELNGVAPAPPAPSPSSLDTATVIGSTTWTDGNATQTDASATLAPIVTQPPSTPAAPPLPNGGWMPETSSASQCLTPQSATQPPPTPSSPPPLAPAPAPQIPPLPAALPKKKTNPVFFLVALFAMVPLIAGIAVVFFFASSKTAQKTAQKTEDLSTPSPAPNATPTPQQTPLDQPGIAKEPAASPTQKIPASTTGQQEPAAPSPTPPSSLLASFAASSSTPSPDPSLEAKSLLAQQEKSLAAFDSKSKANEDWERGQAEEQQGNIPAAIETYLDMEAKYPSDDRGLNRLKVIFKTIGDKRAATEATEPLSSSYESLAQRSAKIGVESAMFLLGNAAKTDDPYQAEKWFSKAANMGYPPAMNELGMLYSRDQNELSANPDRSVELFTRSSDLGDPIGKLYLADTLMNKTGPFSDFYNPQKAIALLKESASMGEPRAMRKLGFFYDKGIGTQPDDLKAFQWYERAWQHGYARAAGDLGIFYMTGRGVPAKDPAKAAQYFAEGAAKQDPFCMTQYAKCLLEGIGVKKDPALARKYFTQAAAKGEQEAVKLCREQGIPTTKK